MWQTVGHEWAVGLLQQAVQREQLAHAWLFAGPSDIGKVHLALELAAALNCSESPPPCGSCASCQRILQGKHPDVALIAPDEGRIKIDQIRELQRVVSLSPYEARRRVCIVRDFHLATVEASNAMLKTLEEPPSRVVLILTATDASLLLPTVVSRCRVLALRLVSEAVIKRALVERWGQSEENAGLLARFSGGRISWAIRAGQDAALLKERGEWLELALDLQDEGRAGRIKAAEGLSKRNDLRDLLRVWQLWWRDVALVASGCDELVINLDYLEALRKLAATYGLSKAKSAVRGVERACEQLDQNVNPRLALEVLLLSWHPASTL